MNSLGTVATVCVMPFVEAPQAPLVTPELVAVIEAEARRLRQREIARLLQRAGEGIRSRLSALKMRLT